MVRHRITETSDTRRRNSARYSMNAYRASRVGEAPHSDYGPADRSLDDGENRHRHRRASRSNTRQI